MTQLLGMANLDWAIIVADRKVTWSTGETLDDPATKLIYLQCFDARMAVAYTGLARIGSDPTGDWLTMRLADALRHERWLKPALERLTEMTTDRFRRLPHRPVKLLVFFLGWGMQRELDTGEPIPALRGYVMSNFWRDHRPQDLQASFTLYEAPPIVPNAWGGPFGAVWNLNPPVEARLYELLAARLPRTAYLGKAQQIIRRITEDPAAGVGFDLMSCAVPSDPNGRVINSYLPLHAAEQSFDICSQVIADHNSVRYMGASTFRYDVPVPVLPVLGRNARCHCGSTRRHKNCCGRGKLFRPLMGVEISPEGPRAWPAHPAPP